MIDPQTSDESHVMKRLPKAFFPFCLLVYGSSSNNSPQVEAQVEFWESGGTSPGGRADLQQELDQALALKTSVCMQQLKNYRIVDSGGGYELGIYTFFTV